MRITDSGGFDMFYLRDDKINAEDEKAEEQDKKKSEKKMITEADFLRVKKHAEIIKLILLVMILITSTIAMIYSLLIYYTQSDTQNLVFLENVMGKTDAQPAGDLIVDTAEDIDINEVLTTQVSVQLPPVVVQQQNGNNANNNNNIINNNNNNTSVTTVLTTVAETTTAALEKEENTDGVVNINTASLDLLMTLPGIGATKANAIINYRNENGAFLSVDELLEVDGIGEKTLEKLRHMVTVDY